MRLKFIGPAESKFAGLDLRLIMPSQARLRDLEELQVATGMSIAKLQAKIEGPAPDADAAAAAPPDPALDDGDPVLGLHTVIFLTLRNAGFFLSWDEAGDFHNDDVDAVAEPGDPEPPGADSETEAGGEDPTPARTGSGPGVAGDAAKTPTGSRPRSKKTVSTTRSAPAS